MVLVLAGWGRASSTTPLMDWLDWFAFTSAHVPLLGWASSCSPVVVSIPSHTSLMLFSRSCFASLVRGLTAVPEALHCFHFRCFHVVVLQLGLEPVSQAATVPHNDRRAVRVANRRLCVSAPSAAVKPYPCCLQSGKNLFLWAKPPSVLAVESSSIIKM